MKDYSIPQLAPIIAKSHGADICDVRTYERRLRHLVAKKVVPVARKEGSGSKARAQIDPLNASLASLLIYFGDVLNFDLRLQSKIAKSAGQLPLRRQAGVYSGGVLSDALKGVEADEDWVMIANFRSDDSLRVHFMPASSAPIDKDTEDLLTASGRTLLCRVVISISSLLRPFASKGLEVPA